MYFHQYIGIESGDSKTYSVNFLFFDEYYMIINLFWISVI